MAISRSDIIGKVFARSVLGYDDTEVDAFLDQIAEDVDAEQKQLFAMQQENEKLKAAINRLSEEVSRSNLSRQEISRVRSENAQLREQLENAKNNNDQDGVDAESAKKALLITSEAEKQAVEILRNAEQKAADIVSNAEQKAAELVQKAQSEAVSVAKNVQERERQIMDRAQQRARTMLESASVQANVPAAEAGVSGAQSE